MYRDRFITFLRWLEYFLNIAVPTAAIIAAISPELFSGKKIDTDTLLRLIIGLIAGIAAKGSIERYVTLRGIESHTKKLSETSNLELLRSAIDSGIVNIFTRSNSGEFNELIQDVVKDIKNDFGSLDICGIALPDMVGQDSFREAVLEHSLRGDIRVMLLDPDSKEAKRREKIEAPLGRKTIADVRDMINWLIIKQTENKRFRLHLYDLPPMLLLIITDQFAYVEPYHFGRPEGIEGCIGGHVPLLKIRNLPELGRKNPYDFYRAHFDYLWDYTRGLRVNLPIMLIEAVPSTYVVMENKMDINICMDEWKLTGQESNRPYQFESNFFWKPGELIKIIQNPENYSEDHLNGQRVFYVEDDFMGNNTILRLTNAVGILVAEWSIPSSP
jgi:hypothetical protein